MENIDSTPYELRIAMSNLDEDSMVGLMDFQNIRINLRCPFQGTVIKSWKTCNMRNL